MLNEITVAHTQRMACVYVRQSTIQQVRSHGESQRRQRGLTERARQLGWRAEKVLVIDEDQGISGAVTTHERPGYLRLLEMVRASEVGIVLAVEVSRLAREDISWQIMFRHCQFGDVLLGDEQHVYDPRDAHQRMMLGLLATFAGFELSVLHERMQQAWKQKAQRGELYCRCPPGYVVEGPRLSKTPDQRVQHVLETVFRQFPHQASVGALCRWCCRNSMRLPVCVDGHGRRIEWREPTTGRLLRMLRHPAYAGAYVLGRSQTREVLLPDGQVRKQTVRLPLDQWPVLIQDHHEAYIGWDHFERNWRRLAANNPMCKGTATRAAGGGEALLAGLLRCRRCGHGLYVRYSGKGAVRYLCLQGGKQRQARTQSCFSFQGQALDELVATLVLEVVCPAGVEAALEAAEQLVSTHRQQRQVRVDQVSQCRYAADRARRQYDEVEPENRLVCAELERRWNVCLVELDRAEEGLLAFDRDTPDCADPPEQEELLELGRNLSSVWFSPQTTIEVKKQIVRLLIEQIAVDITPEDQLHALVHWVGGHHTEHILALRSRRTEAQTCDLQQIIESLRLIADDEQIARALNRAGIATARGATWTAKRVGSFRGRHSIAGFSPEDKQSRGLLRQDEAAEKLGISPMSVHRMLTSGILPGSQARPGLPWVIEAEALRQEPVQTAVRSCRADPASNRSDAPNQPTLW